MNGGNLWDLLNHQVLPPVLWAIKQLIKLLRRHFSVKTTESALDGALDDDFLLVRHKADTAAAILPERVDHLNPEHPLRTHERDE